MKTKFFAFTLAETLIAIAVVGVLSALLIPTLMYNNQKRIIKDRFKKIYATTTTALLSATDEFGAIPKCYYSTTLEANMTECATFYRYYFFKKLDVNKYCNSNGFSNGCLPNYKTEDFRVSSGCSGFKADKIKTSSRSAILKDGSIIFTYYGNMALLGFDVNGFDGPNKPGIDVYGLIIKNEGNGLELGDNRNSTKRTIVYNCLPYTEKWLFKYLDEILN